MAELRLLYHGGAPGFEVGDLITPHGTKHFDDCPTCRARADENHQPDSVFATPVRIYGKYYASKWGRGSLYIVVPEGECSRSQADSIETFYAFSMRVVKISERAVELTMKERRQLYRVWTDADRAAGFPDDPAADRQMHALLSMDERTYRAAVRATDLPKPQPTSVTAPPETNPESDQEVQEGVGSLAQCSGLVAGE